MRVASATLETCDFHASLTRRRSIFRV